MADIIQQLQKDHLNAVKLLDILEVQVRTLHEDETNDYLLMFDVMHYMRQYSDLFHHPKEDLIFEKLKDRDASARPIVDKLMVEHKALEEKGAQFFESLQAIVNESIVSRETLESQGHSYITLVYSHMKKEEDQVFPLASKLLREEDWAEIDMAMESKADPIFGGAVEEKYRTLYKFLIQQDT
jgi:hemerythrin-like domain-containing protein